MERIEFQGKTAEEAIENACQRLKIEKDQMDIEVLEPGSAGIFGLVGGRKAKIKVRVLSPEVEEPEKSNNKTPPSPLDNKSSQKNNEILDDSVLEKGTAIAKDALENILSLIPVENTRVGAGYSDGIISLEIEGDTSGLLIGRKGRTLDALQYIVNKIVNKSLEKRTQVVVDSESYRKRRKDFLTEMALEMATKAKKNNKPLATNLLYPHDRRIVHLALRDEAGVTTKSRGDGLFKKVVIIPK